MFKDIKRFLADLFTRLRQKRFSKKRLIIISVCITVALIPTIIAIWNVYFKEDTNFVSSQDVSVIFVDIINDQELVNDSINEKNLSDSSDIDMLYNIVTKESPDSRPENAPDSPNFKLITTVGSLSTEYSCYFSESADSSYLISDVGTVYSVNKTQYDKFLSSEYSDTVYKSAITPALTTDNGATITPSDVKWYFKKSNGIFERSYNYLTTSAIESYQMSKTVALNFDLQPDICEINVFEISENGSPEKRIYNGGLDQLAYITVQSETQLYFDVKASWQNSQGIDAYGDITYSFIIDCKDYATFELSSTQVLPGQIISIVLHDVSKEDEVIYSTDTDPDITNNVLAMTSSSAGNLFSTDDSITFLKSFTPKFIETDGSLIGLLPIPYGTPSGTLSFTIACGVTKKTFNVDIGPREQGEDVEVGSTYSAASKALSLGAVNEITTLLKSTADESRSAILCSQGFNSLSEQDYSRLYSYADRFLLDGQNQNGILAAGSFYEALTENANYVCSTNSGVVAYVGYTQHLGNVVIIDHGIGIYTWYCNLSDVDVRIGDAVARGELVGKAGASPLIAKNGVLILCSVYNAFIDPELILGNEIF